MLVPYEIASIYANQFRQERHRKLGKGPFRIPVRFAPIYLVGPQNLHELSCLSSAVSSTYHYIFWSYNIQLPIYILPHCFLWSLVHFASSFLGVQSRITGWFIKLPTPFIIS